METLNKNIKAEPNDSNSFLSTPRLQDKKKKGGQPIATIEISSDEDDNATPTPKEKR